MAELRRSGAATPSLSRRRARLALWIGAAMLLQAGQFSLHAWYLVNALQRDRFYAVANNLVTVGILACILVGTLISWRRRAKAATAQVA